MYLGGHLSKLAGTQETRNTETETERDGERGRQREREREREEDIPYTHNTDGDTERQRQRRADGLTHGRNRRQAERAQLSELQVICAPVTTHKARLPTWDFPQILLRSGWLMKRSQRAPAKNLDAAGAGGVPLTGICRLV